MAGQITRWQYWPSMPRCWKKRRCLPSSAAVRASPQRQAVLDVSAEIASRRVTSKRRPEEATVRSAHLCTRRDQRPPLRAIWQTVKTLVCAAASGESTMDWNRWYSLKSYLRSSLWEGG
jgi:hypothetical protein